MLTFASKLSDKYVRFVVLRINIEQMKKMFTTLCALLIVAVLLTSCLGGDDSDTTLYSDTAITAVTLGTLNRYTQSTSSRSGNDTIIKTTLTGSTYRLTIDQLNHVIFNRDSLPVGTDMSHVVISSITAKNNGVVLLKSLTSDTLRYVSSTDSIDFTQPRTLRVFSSDGTASRDYTMTLAASTVTGINFGWKRVDASDDLKAWDDAQLVAIGDTVRLVERGTVMKDGRAFRVSDERVEISDNLTDWTAVAEATGLKTMVGAGTRELFAITLDGRMKVSADDGRNWDYDTLDNDAQLLPTEGMSSVAWPYAPSDSTDYILMAGPSPLREDEMVVWRKISQYGGNTLGGRWIYMTVDDSSRYYLPRQKCISLAYYDGTVLAVGSKMVMMQSRDQGISWKQVSAYALPTGIEGTRICMTADARGRLWLATNEGELWQGTLR